MQCLTIEKIVKDYVEVLVGGQTVGKCSGVSAYKAKDRGAEVSNATLKQVQCHPLRNQLQCSQKLCLPGWDLRKIRTFLRGKLQKILQKLRDVRGLCKYTTFMILKNSSTALVSSGNCAFRCSSISVLPLYIVYFLIFSPLPITKVSKCLSSSTNCSCPSVIWSMMTFNRLFSWSWPM